MLALYRCGRQAEALEDFREARQKLIDELGVEPGVALRELHAAILRQDASLDVPEPPSESTRADQRQGLLLRASRSLRRLHSRAATVTRKSRSRLRHRLGCARLARSSRSCSPTSLTSPG